MSGVFGAISDIQVDVHHNQAWFSYEDIKLHLHDSIIEVDQALLSFEQFNAAMEQLESTVASIESMNGMVDEQIMHIVNHDNQLGKLFGVYFPESLRFEMADDNKAGQTGNATQTTRGAYTATLNCANDGNGYGLVTATVAALTYDELALAGASSSYLVKSSTRFRLMSPNYCESGTWKHYAWLIDGTNVTAQGAEATNALKPVINIKNDVGSAGSGTTGDMYTIN